MNDRPTLRRCVKNLRSSKEGWVPAANLLSLISESKSSQSLSSSGIFPAAAPLCVLTATERPAFHAGADVLVLQMAASLGTSARPPAAARHTPATQTSNPERLSLQLHPWNRVSAQPEAPPRRLRSHHTPKL